MAGYTYKIADGSLYSWNSGDSDPVADATTLAANGMAHVSGLPALDASHVWDAPTKTVVTVTPPTAPRPIATGSWILRFTPQEFQAISGSSDATVQQFMYALNHTTQIDLSDPAIVSGVNYLVSVNALQSSRVASIMGT